MIEGTIEQEMLWIAINSYARACGGNPDAKVFGNSARFEAVVEIETIIQDGLDRSKKAGALQLGEALGKDVISKLRGFKIESVGVVIDEDPESDATPEEANEARFARIERTVSSMVDALSTLQRNVIRAAEIIGMISVELEGVKDRLSAPDAPKPEPSTEGEQS